MKNFSIVVDFEFEVFSDTTLKKIIQEVKAKHLPFGWIRTGKFELLYELSVKIAFFSGRSQS